VEELLDALAERTPAPAGGCGAAWAGAIAAALLQMSADYAQMPEVTERAAALRAELLAAGQDDLTAYTPVVEARRRGASEDEIQAALAAACGPPQRVAQAAGEVAELARETEARSRPALRGDARAAALIAQAAAEAATQIVALNRDA
jgi:formiminotetrahydrofolate cyclodeaminase